MPDPIDPRIPKYTETGDDAAGALINNKAWVSLVQSSFFGGYVDAPSITAWPENDSLLLRFFGTIGDKTASIEFYLTNLKVSKLGDLKILKGKKIQLDGVENIGYYVEEKSSEASDSLFVYSGRGKGQIYFRNIKSYSSNPEKFIMSGTFGFTVDYTDGSKTEAAFGRFDYKIGAIEVK